MSPNFSSLLNRPAGDIKKPPVLPAGTYNGIIERTEFGESTKKKTPFLRYWVKVQTPGEDVDPEELSGIDLGKKGALKSDFYITDDALWRLKSFIESCGVNLTGRTLEEGIPDTLGCQVIISVKHNPSQRGDEIYAEIDSMRGQE